MLQDAFYALTSSLFGCLTGDEVLLAHLQGETSDFVRFNHARVRQAGRVRQATLSLDLISGKCHTGGSIRLSGDTEVDGARASKMLGELRETLGLVPEDPYLNYSTGTGTFEDVHADLLPPPSQVTQSICDMAAQDDLVGFYAGGPVCSGFASSIGLRCWFQRATFNLDWSLYLRADKAVKCRLAGTEWSGESLRTRLEQGRRDVALLDRPAKTLEPGGYRVFLTPAALGQLTGILSWGSFGRQSLERRSSALTRLADGEASLSPKVTITENTAEGFAPLFQEAGFRRPQVVTLVREGKSADALVSPRSAREFSAETNGASSREAPESLDMAAGNLPTAGALEALGTGLYVQDLHYLNFSDRPNARVTGMTRFGTYWVEQGEVVGPVDVMRFDETAYRALGTNLLALTAERELMLNPSTYWQRSTASSRLPGALIEDFRFTL